MKDLRSMNLKEMEELAKSTGEKAFRGKQLFEWVHGKQAVSWDEMKNLPKSWKEKLANEYRISGVRIEKKQISKKKDTAKYLFSLHDGNVIESVWMKYHHGNSVCISSQVGCRMGCTFCASTLLGLSRNLTAGEMLSQIYEIQRDTGERVSNVIVMGMGEPLDNYEELLRFIHLLSHEKGLCIGQRNITVSTCGLVDQIRKLADEKLQITLAISLHAPNDAIRQQTMPVAKRYSMEEIFSACEYYFKKTGRRITFEYSMIRGVNDCEEHAKELIRRCKTLMQHGVQCHINLIPLNEVKERDCHRSQMEDIERFRFTLEKNHINATIRREMGGDIDAACGQLRKNYIDGAEKNPEEVKR